MLKGYRTLLFGSALAVLGFLQAVDWVEFVPAGWEGIVMAVIGAMVMWLRSVTNTPVMQAK